MRLAGHRPDHDIKIEIVGTRPGERLQEYLHDNAETVEPTWHPSIRSLTPKIPADPTRLSYFLDVWRRCCADAQEQVVVGLLDQMLTERDMLNADIQDVLDKQTEGWGIKVSNVELKRIDLEPSMIRAIARQAEAERERRAKIINAEGEQQAAQKLVEAGRMLAPEPSAMQLRYFAALHDIAGERTSTIVFPIPIDLFDTLKK